MRLPSSVILWLAIASLGPSETSAQASRPRPAGASSLQFIEPDAPRAATPTGMVDDPAVLSPPAEENAENGGKDAKEEKEEEKDKEEKDDKDKDEDKDKGPECEAVNVYGQLTFISQFNGPFPSRYQGPHSFLPIREMDSSITTTLFLGARLWEGAELYFNPEVSGGAGLSGTSGIAGFPNGDITRVGEAEPAPYLARFYLAQTWALGGSQEKIESAPNQLAGYRDACRITLYLGKMAAEDWFDMNLYSHDPRTQFMSWALMYNGAWDYPANARGYTYGGLIELNTPKWAFRYGIFGEPRDANGGTIDEDFARAHGQVWELEQRYCLGPRPGKVRWMFYLNRAHMGNYREALDLSPVNPDLTPTQSYCYKYGLGVNVEQELTKNLGGFFRFGWNDGHTESWAFTEIDCTVAFGLVLNGCRWCRPQDQVGLGCAINGISSDHRDFLGAGGLGFLLGDGALNYGQEVVLETYYRCELKKKSIWLSPDFQLVENPGYNRDRGPVAVGGVRMHAEF